MIGIGIPGLAWATGPIVGAGNETVRLARKGRTVSDRRHLSVKTSGTSWMVRASLLELSLATAALAGAQVRCQPNCERYSAVPLGYTPVGLVRHLGRIAILYERQVKAKGNGIVEDTRLRKGSAAACSLSDAMEIW